MRIMPMVDQESAGSASRYGRWVLHLVGAAMILAAVGQGIRTTAHLEWPTGPDMFRDMGAAEAVKQSAGRALRLRGPLADPNYLGEAFWYNPLVPGVVAALSSISGLPVRIIHTRSGAYLNAATPIAFYAFAVVAFGPEVGLLALAMFLFAQPFPSWQSATYSPWLIVSNFAQAFFYATLVAWLRFQRSPSIAGALGVGIGLGLTLLAHTAAFALLGVIFASGTIASLFAAGREPMRWSALGRVAGRALVVIGIAMIVAVPVLATLWRYGGEIRNVLPFIWLDPAMEPQHFREFLARNGARVLTNAGVVMGLVILIRHRRREAHSAVLVWTCGALVLFAWSAYAWRLTGVESLARFSISPAHHFLLYYRAAEALLVGLALGSGVTWLLRKAPPARLPAATLILAGGLAGFCLPSYLGREDFTSYPREAAQNFSTPETRTVIDWISDQTHPRDVFLAPENAALTFVSSVGRKVVIVERFFSNPYVDWYERDRQRVRMWDSLASGDCAGFNSVANDLSVSYVMSVDGLNPPVAEGTRTCQLMRVLESGAFTIYRR